VAGFIVREASPLASNWRAQETLDAYLARHGVVGIAGIDTRALTRRLRSTGVMRGIIGTADRDPAALVARARALPSMLGADLVRGVTCATAFDWPIEAAGVEPAEFIVPPTRTLTRPARIAAYDFGMKWNILRRFAAYGCAVRVFPATAPAEDLIAASPDGIFLSNGPGDPAALGYAVANVRRLLQTRLPVFGICLGHQLLGLALGATTFKLKFGHRGGNHPVKELETGRVEITSQNHGFAVDPATLPSDTVVTHVNLYDGTLEGFRHRERPIFSVQYHPEAAPGPHDADYLFGRFMEALTPRS
jgi:carbamoyl-phosphate synthase small subunit